MDEPNKELEPDKGPESGQGPAEKPERHSPLEPVYQNFQEVPVKYVDIFIGLCFAALVLVLVVGILKGNGLI